MDINFNNIGIGNGAYGIGDQAKIDGVKTGGQKTVGQDIKLSGAQSFDVIRGSGDRQAFVINLYDEATVNVEDVEYRRRGGLLVEEGGGGGSESGMAGDTQQRKPAKGNLMQTGDNISAIGAVALVAAGVVVAIRHARRRYRA